MNSQFQGDSPILALAGEAEPQRTSDVLAAFRADLPADRVTLAHLIAALGDRSLGTVLLALSLPTIAPVPLGVSVLCDLPLMLFSLRLLFGRRDAVLPAWLLRLSVARSTAERMLDAVMPRLVWIEAMLKPRLPALAAVDKERWFGLLIVVLITICIVPVPLMGWLPGFALVLISLGLIERDGGAVGFGLLLGIGAVVFAFVLVTGLSYAGHELLAIQPTP
ncbi:MAG TPA: exopolysaccharide biosynthesis protein [Azospirillum sp.]|nr:exopolysaccharide biosynthesis protein [Azospirillum sp.]